MENKLYFYEIEASFKFNDFVLDRKKTYRAPDMTSAFEQFLDENFIDKKDIVHYKSTCLGELQVMGLINPFSTNGFGKCNWWVYKIVSEMPLDQTIKISSVKSRFTHRDYSTKTIGQALIRLERDGYLKAESLNAMGERTYIKYGQVKA